MRGRVVVSSVFLLALGAAVSACGNGASTDVADSDAATVEADVTGPEAPAIAIGEVEDVGLAEFFSKQVTVFGVPVVGTSATPDEKVLHAAGVMAQYLDNDEDGVADNPRVIEAMNRENAVLVMFADFEERDSSELWESDASEGYAMQDLEAHETLPEEGFDATVEEVLHLISGAGYSVAYPEAFSEGPGSRLADAMDLARGGRFEAVPDEYPEGAWYHYRDETCRYGCMAGEYFYWALTTLLGAQADPQRCEWLANEWEPCTPELLETMDTAVYALMTDSQYRMPTVLPDGSYRVGAE